MGETTGRAVRGRRVRIAVLAAALAAAGCNTLDTRTNVAYDGPRTYSGTRTDLEGVRVTFMALSIPFMMYYLLDLPFSAVADTVLLPVTIGEERERQAALAAEARTDVEVPGPVEPFANLDAAENARRLFEACVALLERMDPRLRHCYSTGARIAHGDREYRGSEFKGEVRALLGRLRETRGFATYQDPSFRESTRGGVRVDAMLSASFVAERTPVAFEIARGADGYWRIVEEIGPAWP